MLSRRRLAVNDLARLAGLAAALLIAARTASAADDGLRKIDAPRFGIAIQAPLAWNLVRWSEDDKAFVLKLPQENGSPAGYVTCDLGLPPETLADYQRQHQEEEDQREKTSAENSRKLVSNELQKDAAAPDDQRLITVWELATGKGDTRFEVAVRMIRNETLYTFTLTTDEAHFAAYRADFDDLLARQNSHRWISGLVSCPAAIGCSGSSCSPCDCRPIGSRHSGRATRRRCSRAGSARIVDRSLDCPGQRRQTAGLCGAARERAGRDRALRSGGPSRILPDRSPSAQQGAGNTDSNASR